MRIPTREAGPRQNHAQELHYLHEGDIGAWGRDRREAAWIARELERRLDWAEGAE